MTKITNKDVVQSYVFTTARYDFSIHEKRIMYRIIEVMQSYVNGLKLSYDYTIHEDMFTYNRVFTIPIFVLANDGNYTNYEYIKRALYGLRNKTFEYEDSNHWGVYGIIEMPKIKRYSDLVEFTITPLLWNAFLNFSKGFRKYELMTAINLRSVYSMRFYELLSGKKQPITYTINDLRDMFFLGDKYQRINSFISRVIDSAKNELDSVSPYSFTYKVNKLGRSYHSITFYPVYIPSNRDESLESQDLSKKVSLSWDLDTNVINYLKNSFGFTSSEIKQHIDLFKRASSLIPDFIGFLSNVGPRANRVKSPKGYIINSIRSEIKNLSY